MSYGGGYPAGPSGSRRPGSSGSSRSSGSSGSNTSTSSVDSVLSNDSYLATLDNVDGRANTLMTGERQIDDTIRRVLAERHAASRRQKTQDPEDNARRAWTARMEADYHAYKAAVERMATAKYSFDAALRDAKSSRVASVSLDHKIHSRQTALSLGKTCLNETVRAAQARSGFMQRYPDAFGAAAARGHVVAIEQLLNLAGRTRAEIEEQYNAMTTAVELDRRRAASAQAPQPVPGAPAPPFGQVQQNPGWFHNPANPGYYQGGSSRR